MDLQNVIKTGRKMDVYGSLLTEKQKQVLNSYVNYDGSISEIAEDLGITRQAVLDLIRRTVAKLNQYEKKMKICEKLDKIYEEIPKITAQRGLTKAQEQYIINLIRSVEK